MKKIVSILLVSLFVVHHIGFYAYFGLRLMDIRREMRQELASLPESRLQTLILSEADFHDEWLDELEMEWNDGMYDIARIEHIDGKVKVLCMRDTAEDDLYALLEMVSKVTSRDKKDVPSGVLQFLSLIFIPSDNPLSLPEGVAEKVRTSYLGHFLSPDRPIQAPPPRRC